MSESPPSITTGELSSRLDGQLIGPAELPISGVESVDRANASQITLVGTTAYARAWPTSTAGAAIVDRDMPLDPGEGRALIRVDDPDIAVARVLEMFAPPPPRPGSGVHPSATIAADAHLGQGVEIGPGCSIGPRVSIGAGTCLHANVTILDDSTIGAECTLWPGVVVRERCSVGDRCILHPNVVVGSDGFGYRPSPDGRSLVKIPHIGTVRLGDEVELGAATCVDRGKFAETYIGDGTRVDNLCQIGHNCRIGRCVVMAGMTGLGGSVEIGDGAQIGGHAVIKEHCVIGPGGQLGGSSALMRDLPAGEAWFGSPARLAKTAFREFAALKRLPDAMRRMKSGDRG